MRLKAAEAPSASPSAIALAASIAARFNAGRYKMLKWDRQEEKYFPLEADLNYKAGANNE